MTVCPFMSRPVEYARTGETVTAILEIECKREECAAWGPVKLATFDDVQAVRPRDQAWRTGPTPFPREIEVFPPLGCRLIGGEVPE